LAQQEARRRPVSEEASEEINDTLAGGQAGA